MMPAFCSGQPRSAAPITVLVVDDSFFMRTLISDLLGSDPGISVVATARSGSDAIRTISNVRPDCVVLDLMMPGMDGLATLKIIMAAFPTPVIILSAHGREGADLTRRCRAAGAVAVLCKPSGEVSLDIASMGKLLVEEVHRAARNGHNGAETTAARRVPRTDAEDDLAPDLIVLGASTGGQPTLERIMGTLEHRFPVPVLIVQHAPDPFLTESFAERLNEKCDMAFKVAEDGECLHPGVAYLAPGGSVVTIEQRAGGDPIIQVRPAPDDVLTPSIDDAMQSAARALGPRVLGVILTGMGQDGVAGMRAIREAGGGTLVENHSAATFDLPKAVIDARLADRVMSADDIGRTLAGAVAS